MQLLEYTMNKERSSLMIKTFTVFLFQISISAFLLEREIDEQLMQVKDVQVPSVDLAFVRFIT